MPDTTPKRVGGRNHVAGAVLLGLGEPDVEVGAERAGDLVAEELAQGATGDAADDLGLEVALGDQVVAAHGPRLPPGGLGGEVGGAGILVVEVGHGDGRGEAGEPGGVAHDLRHGDLVLAVGGELRPVPGDRRVEVEIAPVGEHQQRGGRHRLGGRPDVHDRVPLPRGAVLVSIAAPEVDDRLAPQGHAGAGAQLVALIEVGGEGVSDRLEARRARPADLGHLVPLSRHRALGPRPRGT